MTSPKRKRRGACSPEVAAAVSAILAMAGVASAQAPQNDSAGQTAAPAPEPEPEGGLNEVIVTATKRSERLQDVPESITAIDSSAIAERGLSQLSDLVKMVPGLSISEREPGGTSIIFRGVASSGVQFGSVSSSGLYLDETPITQSGRSPDPRFIDIERIEALRGPQGTLYGASSQSGTLRVITNKPDNSGFSSWVDADFSGVKSGDMSHDVSAMINLPLVADKLTMRLVGFTTEDAGFIDNVLASSQGGTFTNADLVDKNVNKIKTDGGRAALRFDASDNVSATLEAIFQKTRADGHGDVDVDSGDLHQVRFAGESLNDKWYQIALSLNASLPFADAVVSTSYFHRDFRYEADATAYEFAFNQNAIAYDSPVYDFGGDPRGFAKNHERPRIKTFEARLASKADSGSRWGWIGGVFYSDEKAKTDFDSFIQGYGQTPSFAFFNDYEVNYLSGNPLDPNNDTWFLGRYDTELEQKAVFGELSYDLTENFKITAGGRYFDYKRKFAQIQEAPPGFTGFSALNGNQKTSEDGEVWKLNFTYKFDRDHMVYATYSEGFRVGGSNPLKPASALPRDYKSDTLTNYEIGAKTEWFERRLRVNLAAYLMKWDGIAVQIEDPQPAVFQLGFVNLPSAKIKGVEGDFAVTLTQQLQLDGAFSFNDAKVDGAAQFLVTGGDGTVYTFDVSDGARLPLTPKKTVSLGLEFRPEQHFWDMQPYARFDYSYVGSSINSLAGIESIVSGNPPEVQHAYETGDLRIGLDGEHWSGSIYAENLWDERAELFINNRWKAPRLSINRPRTIGIQLRYNF
jgi:outer membrane receptor protein involved in Fe transport